MARAPTRAIALGPKGSLTVYRRKKTHRIKTVSKLPVLSPQRLSAERKQTPQVIENPGNRENASRYPRLLTSRKSAVRACDRPPIPFCFQIVSGLRETVFILPHPKPYQNPTKTSDRIKTRFAPGMFLCTQSDTVWRETCCFMSRWSAVGTGDWQRISNLLFLYVSSDRESWPCPCDAEMISRPKQRSSIKR